MSFKTTTRMTLAALALAAASQANAVAVSSVFITEWMYSGSGGEFIEFTNTGTTAVDFTGWSYDDDSRAPGTFDLSGFGVVAAGESVVITEDDAAQFRADWGLDSSVKVLGGYSNNIGRNDEINLYGAFDGVTFPLIDSLTYGDEDIPGSIRTKDVSGNPDSLAVLGVNDASQWVFSSQGDVYGSYLSANGDLGNPGSFNPVPVPAAVWLFVSGLAGLIGFKRKSA